MNTKNLLQEYCQKNKLELPVYKSQAVGTGWVSFVSLGELTAHGNQQSTKSIADMSAAEVMLQMLPQEKPTYEKCGLYMFDLENSPAKGEPADDQIWLGFCSSNYHSISQYASWEVTELHNIRWGGKYLFTVSNHGLKEIADHYISSYMFPVSHIIANMRRNTGIFFVSRDKSAWCNRVCLLHWLGKFFPDHRCVVEVI